MNVGGAYPYSYFGGGAAAPQQASQLQQPAYGDTASLAPPAQAQAHQQTAGYGYYGAAAPPAAAVPTPPQAGVGQSLGGYANTAASAAPQPQPLPSQAPPARHQDPYLTQQQQQQQYAQPGVGVSSYYPPPSRTAEAGGSRPISGPGVATQQPYQQQPYQQQQQPPPPQPQPQPQPQRQQAASSPAGDGTVRRLARYPENRRVQLSSAPNPLRDIVYSDVPRPYENSANNPPLAATDFIGKDDGNVNPKFFRFTSGAVPAEDRLVKDSHTPFGAVLSPLSRPLYPEEEVPVVTGRPPVRCRRCRGYISCHARFVDMGRSWTCPLCDMTNEVVDSYFCNLDPKGRRLDRAEKPELSRGSVEFDVSDIPEYSLRSERDEVVPARPLHHLFLIDVSQRALATFLPDYVDAILDGVCKMAESTPQCRVAFITYASQLHFYNLRHSNIPQMCVADTDNPFVPLPFAALCWIEVGPDLELIKAFLARVVTYAADLCETGSALGAAVKAAMLVLAGQHGGRIIMSARRSPEQGLGSFTPRPQHQLYGADKEKELLRPIEGFWTTIATTAARQQISFDLFMFSDSYCELVTVSQLCHVTNGTVVLFPNYDPLIDNTKVKARMLHLLTEEAGYAGMLRVRCSSGLRVRRYQGHYLSQNVQDMDLANITGSSTFFVEVAHEGKLEKSSYVYFQTALLYTTRAGRRMVRLHSYRATVASTLTMLTLEMDLEATLVGLIHDVVGDVVNKGPPRARENVMDRVMNLLIQYRRYCTSKKESDVLLMPTRLKLVPVYVVCLLKSNALATGTTVSIDSRVESLYDLVSMPVHRLLSYLYPSLFALHHLMGNSQIGEDNPATGKCILPPRCQLIFESVATHGVYALCDEQSRLVYMWIGSDVDPAVAEFLFGCRDARTVCRQGGPGEDGFHERLRNVLYALTLREDGMRRLVVIHEKEHAEEAFFKQLKEEKGRPDDMGYDKFLVHLHRTVNNALTYGSSKALTA